MNFHANRMAEFAVIDGLAVTEGAVMAWLIGCFLPVFPFRMADELFLGRWRVPLRCMLSD